MNELRTTEFIGALQFVIDATRKEQAPLINKYALQTVIGSKGIKGAMQRTPKADKAQIKALSNKVLSAFIARKLRLSGTLTSTTTAQFKALVEKERKRRMSAAGYTGFVGWSNAAKDFGGTGAVGSGKAKVGDSKLSEARKGSGRKATTESLTAIFTNTAPMSEDIGLDPLQQSLDAQTGDMIEYGNGKLQEVFNKVAGHA